MDLYLQRIRKYSSTMPETALPPQNAQGANNNNAARIGTSNDTSWAGWAISSFTNKLTAAKGQIQPTANGSGPAMTETARSASVNRPEKSSSSEQSGASEETLSPTAPPLVRSSSNQSSTQPKEEEEADDVYDAWGAMDDDDQGQNEKGEAFFDTAARSQGTPSPARSPARTTVPFDDGGEPDFAGWLAAQSKAKAKKPLPKGLTKSASTKKTTARIANADAAKPKAAAPAKQIDTKPKDEGDDDSWAAWDWL